MDTSNDALSKPPVILDRKSFLLATTKALANVLKQESFFFPRDNEIDDDFLYKITKVYMVFIRLFDEADESNFQKYSLLSYIKNIENTIRIMQIKDREIYDSFFQEIQWVLI
jgi:hypothetical protein